MIGGNIDGDGISCKESMEGHGAVLGYVVCD